MRGRVELCTQLVVVFITLTSRRPLGAVASAMKRTPMYVDLLDAPHVRAETVSLRSLEVSGSVPHGPIGTAMERYIGLYNAPGMGAKVILVLV